MNRFVALGPLALTLAAAGCCLGPSVDQRLRSAQAEHERLEVKVRAAKQAEEGRARYKKILQGTDGGQWVAVYYTKSDVEAFARKILPYEIPAADFDKRVSGTIVVERLNHVEFHGGNRVTAQALLRGRNVKYNGSVPDAYKGMVRKFTEGIAAGVVADLDSVVVLDPGRKALEIHSRCTRTQMKANSTPQYEDELRKGMNQRALKQPLRVDLGIDGTSSRPTDVILTGNHAVVLYSP